MRDVVKLKKVNVLGEYIAILKVLDIPEGLDVDKDYMDSASNEGVVVGVGPDANLSLNLGDRVIFFKKNYMAMCPASGGYEGKTVIIARKADLAVRIGTSDKYVFEK